MPTDGVEKINAQIKEEIYDPLISIGLFPEVQKGCSNGAKETGELMYIDQHILKKSKPRQKI